MKVLMGTQSRVAALLLIRVGRPFPQEILPLSVLVGPFLPFKKIP